MNNESTEIQLTPIELLTYCQNKLISLPITVAQTNTIGEPVKEVADLLEKLKQAMLNPSNLQEERAV